MQVIPEKALERSGKRVPFPINVVCKGENKDAPTPPENRADLLSLGEHTAPMNSFYYIHSLPSMVDTLHTHPRTSVVNVILDL